MIIKPIKFEIKESDTEETLVPRLNSLFGALFAFLPSGMWELEIRKPKRTNSQNRALHLFFQHIADQLNSVGVPCESLSVIDKRVIAESWDAELVKNRIWRPVQKAKTGKTSTTEITTAEVDDIAKPIMELLTNAHGIGLMFPSRFAMQIEEEEKKLSNLLKK